MSSTAESAAGGPRHDNAGHWRQTAQHWRQIGPPLRPVVEDLAFCWNAVQDWVRDRSAPRVLLLGVTPELHRLPWPSGTDFLAVDRTQAMIDAAWPGPKGAVLCADWLDLALPDGSRDIALLDGGLHLLAYPQDQRRLARVLQRVLSDGGLCVLRLYVPPREPESLDAVLADLLEGRIANLNILKLRLGMAMQESADSGVELDAAWRALHDAAPDLDALAARIGWPAGHVQAMTAYRGAPARYHYVTVDQAFELFCRDPGGFEVCDVRVPTYEMGEQCPTVVLERRAEGSQGDAPARTGP